LRLRLQTRTYHFPDGRDSLLSIPQKLKYHSPMPRVARIVVPGVPHHVTQRGNDGQDVFFVDQDRRHYLALLREQARAVISKPTQETGETPPEVRAK